MDECQHSGQGFCQTGDYTSVMACPACGKVLSLEIKVNERGQILSTRPFNKEFLELPIQVSWRK